MLDEIVDIFRIDVVHIHHLKGHFFDIIEVIKENDLRSIISLHDYYSVCFSINKLIKNKFYCGTQKNRNCNECFVNINSWRKEWSRLLSMADKLIVPSKAAKEEISIDYEGLNIDVIEHGVDIKHVEESLNIDENTEFNIAFIGATVSHKGSSIAEDLVRKARYSNIRIHLFGITSSKKLQNNHRNFINHGKYDRKDLSCLLQKNNIKLVCIFSICPETYCYTLTESVANNIPVIGIDLGAVGQRIKDNHLGWLVKLDTKPSEIFRKIKDVFKNKAEYKNMSESLSRYEIKSLEEMNNEYCEIYNGYESRNIPFSIEKIKNISRKGSINRDSNNENYDRIVNSLRWKLVSKLKLPIFVSNLLRKIE
jgi:hypothetical protein